MNGNTVNNDVSIADAGWTFLVDYDGCLVPLKEEAKKVVDK